MEIVRERVENELETRSLSLSFTNYSIFSENFLLSSQFFMLRNFTRCHRVTRVASQDGQGFKQLMANDTEYSVRKSR